MTLSGEWLTRRRACLALALLVGVQLVLGLRDLGLGLPYVFHSDYDQIKQAVQLLGHGWFTDSSGYTLPLVWVYAGAAACSYALLHVLHLAGQPGPGYWTELGADWPSFVERFADPSVHHVVGRVVGLLCAAALVLATWRLARVRCSRSVSLLAAAVMAVDPVMMLTARQVRPHLPGVLLIVLAAPSVLRLALRDGSSRSAGWRDGLRAGTWIGVGAAVFQGAALLAPVALLFIAVRVRTLRRAAITATTMLGSMVVTAGLITVLARAPDAVRQVPGSNLTSNTGSLSLPARILSWGHATRFPETIQSWVAAEPGMILGVLAFAALCLVARRRGGLAPLDLLLFGAWPLIQLVSMGVFYGAHVRYVLASAPFLAVLAASLCLAPGARRVRVLLVLLLVAMPLSLSVRALTLMRTVDTRIALDALLSELQADTGPGAAAPFIIAMHDSLALDRSALPPGTHTFPPYRDVTRWGEAFSPRQELRASGAVLYARDPGARWSAGPLDARSMEWLGFSLYGSLGSSPQSRLYLPDAPDALWPDLWRTTRRGPPIELWVARGPVGDTLRAKLQRIARPEELAEWTGEPNDERATVESAVASALGRAEARRAAPQPSLGSDGMGGAGASGTSDLARIDLDGDGVEEDVASNVGAAQLLRLIALPTERGRDLGGALGPAVAAVKRDAPTLRLHATLHNDEPLLLLVRGARPGARTYFVFGSHALNAGFRGGVLVPSPDRIIVGPAAGPQGDLALAALWPHSAPARLSFMVQCWIQDADGPSGYTATNALVGTSPD